MSEEFPIGHITEAASPLRRRVTGEGPEWTVHVNGRDLRILEVQFVRNEDDLYLVETSKDMTLTTRDRLPETSVQNVKILGPFAIRLRTENEGTLTVDSYGNDHLILQLLEDFPGRGPWEQVAEHLNSWRRRRGEGG